MEGALAPRKKYVCGGGGGRGGGGGGVWTAAGVIQYICALHYGKRRRWKRRSEHAEIYSLGCRGAEIAISGASGGGPSLLWGHKGRAGCCSSLWSCDLEP